MNFKKAGTTRDIAGYKCTDYDGGGHMMAGDYTVKECFSTTRARGRGVCGVRETHGGQAQERGHHVPPMARFPAECRSRWTRR